MFELYLKESGLGLAFKIIFEEVLMKKIPADQAFAYAAARLRQFEQDTGEKKVVSKKCNLK